MASGEAEATWLPFELHPEIPAAGMARADYFGAARVEEMERRLQAIAAEVGLTMRGRERLINSRRALATAEFARERGAFETVHEALFRVHWEGEGPDDIDDLGVLRRVVAEAGLDPDELEQALEAGRYDELIDANRREATSVGINAIPAHVFGRRFLLVGAQPDEVYAQVLGRLRGA